MRHFNVTGTCVKRRHYMVDISKKLDAIEKLVEGEMYFTINRARQYGKTTTLLHLEKRLEEKGGFICASISFEDAGVNAFSSEESFCKMFLGRTAEALNLNITDENYANAWKDESIKSFAELRLHITKICKNQKVVLMIDEVDKSSNNGLFLHFLGMLRSKYLLRQSDKDFTFHSVILAGVTDIKNLKLKIINEGLHTPKKDEGKIVNSPWNIAADFDVDMSFDPDEIAGMLADYDADYKTGMDIKEIANEIHEYTNGYPFLVSRICKLIDEKLEKDWTKEVVAQAVRTILMERNTLFDDMVKNMENNPELCNFMYDILILGVHKSFRLSNMVVDLANTYCYIKEGSKGNCAINNRIFERYLTDYFISKDENASTGRRTNGVIYQDVVKNGSFDMAACLVKFAEYFREIYADKEMLFFERHGRLLFMSFLTPLLNGYGFIHIETALTDQRRMDLVVDFIKQQFIIELKLWRGEAAKEQAYEQLLGYMETKNAQEGYLLTFDFRRKKTGDQKPGWVEVAGKRIFDVVI